MRVDSVGSDVQSIREKGYGSRWPQHLGSISVEYLMI